MLYVIIKYKILGNYIFPLKNISTYYIINIIYVTVSHGQHMPINFNFAIAIMRGDIGMDFVINAAL
jgi:hypothetical protein